MFDSDAICRGRTSFRGDCLPSEVDFDRYLSWPDMVLFLYDFLQKSTFIAICGVPEQLGIVLFAFDAGF